MNVTETTAAEMWCPMVRIAVNADHGPATVNDPSMPHYAGNCVGSKCMMWRWQVKGAYVERRGYCGMAGEGSIT